LDYWRTAAQGELEISRGSVLMVSEGYPAAETERAFVRAAKLADILGDQARSFGVVAGAAVAT
jgi:hypothetical protein